MLLKFNLGTQDKLLAFVWIYYHFIYNTIEIYTEHRSILFDI